MKERKTAIIFTEEERAITAAAIKEGLLKINPTAIVIIIGMMEIRTRVIADFISNLANINLNPSKIVTKVKQRVNYKNINNIPRSSLTVKQTSAYRNMENILLRYDPSLVITVGIGATQEVCAVRNKLKSTFKVLTVVDEYALNRNVIYDYVDAYMVPNMAVKTEMVNCYVDEDKIFIANIPIMNNVKESIDKNTARNKLNIDTRMPTLLLVVAPNDNEAFKSQIEVLDKYKNQYNIRVFVYDNKEAVSVANSYNLKVYTDLDELNKLYSVADIVLSCPFSAIIEPAFRRGILVALSTPQTALEEKVFNYLTDKVAPCENNNRLIYFLDKYPREEYENIRKEGEKLKLRDPNEFFSLFF